MLQASLQYSLSYHFYRVLTISCPLPYRPSWELVNYSLPSLPAPFRHYFRRSWCNSRTVYVTGKTRQRNRPHWLWYNEQGTLKGGFAIILWQIFSSFFKIGAFTIGGGYAMLPVMQREVVNRLGWLNEQEFMETIAVTQSAPGAIAVNTAILIGKQMAGLPGVVAGCLGAVLPSFIIILVIAAFFHNFLTWSPALNFFAGVRPAVVALIAHVAWKMGRRLVKNAVSLILFLVSLALIVLIPGLHPIWVIFGSGVATVLWATAQKQPQKGAE